MHRITKEELNNWIKKIGYRIFLIKTSRNQYDKFIDNYKKDRFKGLGDEFLWWIRNNYEFTIIILLTGLLEGSNRDDDLNFQKFLKQVKKYGLDNIKSELLADKPKYYSDFNNMVLEELDDNDYLEKIRREEIENCFKNLKIEQDIETINNNFLKLKTLRDKQIAHMTSYEQDIKINDIELDNIIDEIIAIFDTYSFLIGQTTYVFN